MVLEIVGTDSINDMFIFIFAIFCPIHKVVDLDTLIHADQHCCSNESWLLIKKVSLCIRGNLSVWCFMCFLFFKNKRNMDVLMFPCIVTLDL
jgi:hypothetical protein